MTPDRDRPMSVDDWIDAGFDLLAEGGIDALRIGRLCDRLNVTKGSFYWHFADIHAYRAAVVEAWSDRRHQERRRYVSTSDVPARERLTVMMAALVRPAHWAVERVMRTWAMTDQHVAAQVREADLRVLDAARQAFADAGFDDRSATLRATIMFAAGVGLLSSADPSADAPAEVREEFLDFMLRP